MVVGVAEVHKIKQRTFKKMNTIGCVFINNVRVNSREESKIRNI